MFKIEALRVLEHKRPLDKRTFYRNAQQTEKWTALRVAPTQTPPVFLSDSLTTKGKKSMHIKADVVVFVAVLVLSFIVGSYVASTHSASETSEITVEESAIVADSTSASSDASAPSEPVDVATDLEPDGAVTADIPTGDPERGRDLATRLCSGCHALPPATESPVPKAPNFAELAGRWPVDSLAEAFAEGIIVGHGDHVQMPEFSFDPQEIEDLLAYLNTLQE